MPRMDGLTFLKKIMRQAPMPVVVISNQTIQGADVALKALEMGAVDVMSKPNLSNESAIRESGITLTDKIRSAYFAKRLRGSSTKFEIPREKSGGEDQSTIRPFSFSPAGVIAIGASTGGTEAIRVFLQGLPPQMPPILIVQHMPEKFTASFAKRLDDLCSLTVKEAEDGETVMSNTVYIAPGGLHMIIKNQHGKTVIKIYNDDLVNRHRPSVNVLFQSVAEVKGRNAIGIIMTGMGDDGADGMRAMHDNGAYTIAQDEASSVVYGMPSKAVLAGGVSKILPLNEMANEVCDVLRES
jgi:two-component system chemotaxis response regulator CheB